MTVKHLMYVWEAVAYLLGELHRLLEVVLVDSTSTRGLQWALDRKQKLETVVSLLGEAQQQTPRSVQHDLGR